MPRPPDFTDDMQAFCDAEMADFRARQRRGEALPHRIPDFLFDMPHLRETWYCGTWLDRKLAELGCPREQIRKICFANGQRCAMARDPWVNTLATLEGYRAGQVDEPGPELAERLLREGRPT